LPLIIPVPFTVVDAALLSCLLEIYENNWPYMARREISSMFIVYVINPPGKGVPIRSLGNCGEIRLRELIENRTKLEFADPQYPTKREALGFRNTAWYPSDDVADEVLTTLALEQMGNNIDIQSLDDIDVQQTKDQLLEKLSNTLLEKRQQYQDMVVDALYSRLKQDNLLTDNEEAINPDRGLAGRPTLTRDDLIYRLAKAQEGEEIKAADNRMTWGEICFSLNWRYSFGLFRDARRRLEEAIRSKDPILDDVEIYRMKQSNSAESD